jgi:thymidylate synthase (FAD)
MAAIVKTEEVEIVYKSTITVKQIQIMGGDHMIVATAKVSTSGEEAEEFAKLESAEGNWGLINYLVKQRHGTPFEHGAVTFFVHAPIFVWREWHRHRIGFSYNEESGRYKELSPVFYIPPPERKLIPVKNYKAARPEFGPASPEEYSWLVEDLKAGYEDAYRRYKERLNRGYAKEVARAGLPVGIFSSCWVTCNPRSLMSFLSLRTHEPDAKFVSYPQAEIEVAARVAETFLAKGWPLTYKAFCQNGRVGP